jgi:hypothetical protein
MLLVRLLSNEDAKAMSLLRVEGCAPIGVWKVVEDVLRI